MEAGLSCKMKMRNGLVASECMFLMCKDVNHTDIIIRLPQCIVSLNVTAKKCVLTGFEVLIIFNKLEISLKKNVPALAQFSFNVMILGSHSLPSLTTLISKSTFCLLWNGCIGNDESITFIGRLLVCMRHVWNRGVC